MPNLASIVKNLFLTLCYIRQTGAFVVSDKKRLSEFELFTKLLTVINVDTYCFQDNQYIEAIKTVGSVLGYYDLDQNFLAFGFGAKSKPNKRIKDCFPLDRKADNPVVKGIQVFTILYY